MVHRERAQIHCSIRFTDPSSHCHKNDHDFLIYISLNYINQETVRQLLHAGYLWCAGAEEMNGCFPL